MPFTLLKNYKENQPLELDVALQDRLWLYSQIIALAHSHCWKIDWFDFHLLEDTCLFYFGGRLFLISWYFSYGFVQYWNCILMRNHNVTEQSMRLEGTASLLLKEAMSFIER